ncbi:cytochrome c3 family protein [Thermodesulfatator indicus]|nr:cytochrome c3 family protein [Thermodesulfatator indicus]
MFIKKIILLFVANLIFASAAKAQKIFTPKHDKIDCIACHKSDYHGKPTKELIYGGNVIKICQKCHQQVMKHPTAIKVKNRTIIFSLMKLPLYNGKITCTTCHQIHLRENVDYLLRSKNFLRHNRDILPNLNLYSVLCVACHGDFLEKKNVHDRQKNNCTYCHLVSIDKDKNNQRLKDFLGKYSCTPCHQNVICSIDRGYNPFIDPEIQKKAKELNLNLSNKKPICTTCHLNHFKTKEENSIKETYLLLAWESRSINPHWKKLFCKNCHSNQPSPNRAPLKNKNFNQLCQRCHNDQFARADIHPVGIKPKKIKVPKFLPLQDGLLTCETCHNARIQCFRYKEAKRINPLFLRVAGLSRYQFCFLCHEANTYRRMNPHENQIDKKGQVIKEKCLLCHSSVPDPEHNFGLKDIKFAMKDPDECCIGCHPGYEKNHPAGYTHTGVKPSKKIKKAIDTSIERIGVEIPLYNGRIICATCHNPHQEGVIKFKAAATGSLQYNKLRLKATTEMCLACHIDKAFHKKSTNHTIKK